jgi:hypothetical protein
MSHLLRQEARNLVDPSATRELENESSKHDSFPNGMSQCPGTGDYRSDWALGSLQAPW